MSEGIDLATIQWTDLRQMPDGEYAELRQNDNSGDNDSEGESLPVTYYVDYKGGAASVSLKVVGIECQTVVEYTK